jgi:hypothetical protein
MSFAAPLMLLGLAAGAVPLIIHLIGRRRAPRLRFAAIDFVLRTDRRIARRLKLRQYLLLAMRVLLAAGIAVMMAKPFTEAPSDLPAVSTQPQSAVLIVDDTLSMRRRVEGAPLYVRAKERARQLVDMLGGKAELAILSLSSPGGPLTNLTRESRKVLAAITQLEVGHAHAKAAPALTQAARILAESSLRRRQVYLLTDAAAHGLPDGDPQALLRGNIQLHVVDVAGDAPRNNGAVVELSAAPSMAPGQRTTRITARICNHGETAFRRRVALSVDGREVARGFHQLGGWSCGNKSFQHSFARAGMHNATVSIDADQLPEDDERHLRLEVGSAVRVLLVNGAPSPVRHRDELFYLQTALATPAPGGQPMITKTVTVDELGQVGLSTFDVVALCNVAAVPDERLAELRGFVEKGGGLLVSVGDNVDTRRYNAGLSKLLPAPLRGPLTAAPRGTGAPALRLGRADAAHPILRPFWSDRRGGGLRKTRFHRVYRLRPAVGRGKRVVLWYDDGSPALAEVKQGEGRVLLFTSTLDRDWNDLPIRPGYLPLVVQMVRYLSGVPVHAPRRSAEVGRSLTFRIPSHTQQLRLVGPGGLEQLWTKRELSGRPTIEIPVPAAGFYKLSTAGTDGVLLALERESFVANINPAESDLRKAKLTKRQRGLGASGTARATRRVELWHGLGALLLLLLIAEGFLTRRG